MLQLPDDACKMARQAFEDAIAELDNVAEDSYKDSSVLCEYHFNLSGQRDPRLSAQKQNLWFLRELSQ